jgi:hypothetical protein
MWCFYGCPMQSMTTVEKVFEMDPVSAIVPERYGTITEVPERYGEMRKHVGYGAVKYL